MVWSVYDLKNFCNYYKNSMNLGQGVLKKFRELMALRNIGIYVLPRTDEHQVSHSSFLEWVSVPLWWTCRFHLWIHRLQCYCVNFSGGSPCMDWWKILPASWEITERRLVFEKNDRVLEKMVWAHRRQVPCKDKDINRFQTHLSRISKRA